AERLTYNMFLLLINIGGLIVLILLAISGNVWFGFFLCFFLGLFMAAMFAIALIITNLYFPGQTEKTTSILLATNGLGGSLIPIIIGQSMDKYPAQVTFWLFACIMLIMLILIIGIQLLGNTRLSVIREHDNNHKF
ncbi:MFS transporter, partial [Bacillus pseudomycoides]